MVNSTELFYLANRSGNVSPIVIDVYLKKQYNADSTLQKILIKNCMITQSPKALQAKALDLTKHISIGALAGPQVFSA